ncbi:MAG TPA: glycosyltransferase family 2 protein, partial [Flavobacteriales bacterium]|nr:glycosyltransferase family 2 protein [Flavobacteriales bacterium]
MSGNADLFAGICVVVPTFNNARTLEDVLERVEHVLRSEGTAAPCVIVVDDGSTDDTSRILGKVKNIHVLRVPVNRGKGNALRRGFDAALKLGFRNAITIDSDGQHDPADLPALARAIQDDPDAM